LLRTRLPLITTFDTFEQCSLDFCHHHHHQFNVRAV
jgi:hypothetical protein